MIIEHFALNVTDPTAASAWYVQHLGLCVGR
jgi:catechol 2,3-dioxygenase-like lactoylglutathione lyase family enzyme